MEIDAIKKKVLEDVDPETRRKKKKEMRIQRLIIAVPGDSSSGDPDLLYTDGNLDC